MSKKRIYESLDEIPLRVFEERTRMFLKRLLEGLDEEMGEYQRDASYDNSSKIFDDLRDRWVASLCNGKFLL